MCVWSAYTGKKAAAPIIWESLKSIEGLWAGFYTGLVTCHDGKLHMGKVWGNTDVWSGKFEKNPSNSVKMACFFYRNVVYLLRITVKHDQCLKKQIQGKEKDP